MTRRRAALAAVVAVVAVGWASAPPARAHPFGPPPTAAVSAQGATVTIQWSAAADDGAAVGELLGIMPEGSAAAYRQEAAAQVAPSRTDEAALTASPQLRDYLTSHIEVSQGGRLCRAEIVAMDDFVHGITTIQHTCPAQVTEVTLRITMLHDIHPAYRTLATGENSTPATAVFTVEAPEHRWRFGASAAPPAASLAAGVLALIAGVLAAVWLVRRRRAA